MRCRIKEQYQLYYPQYNKGQRTLWQWKYFKNILGEKEIIRCYPDAKKLIEQKQEDFRNNH